MFFQGPGPSFTTVQDELHSVFTTDLHGNVGDRLAKLERLATEYPDETLAYVNAFLDVDAVSSDSE